jgi:hypothetical protein
MPETVFINGFGKIPKPPPLFSGLPAPQVHVFLAQLAEVTRQEPQLRGPISELLRAWGMLPNAPLNQFPDHFRYGPDNWLRKDNAL